MVVLLLPQHIILFDRQRFADSFICIFSLFKKLLKFPSLVKHLTALRLHHGFESDLLRLWGQTTLLTTVGSFSDKSSFSENIFPKEFHSWLWTQITHQKKLVILSAWQALSYYPVNAAALCISSCVAVARRPQQLLRSSSNSCWASSLICHKPKGSSGERMLSPATAWLHYSDAPALSLS